MSLADWERNGWLTSHSTSRQEIADLLAVVERDLADSATESVSPDWRLNIAYNAALQAAKAALAAAGYRVSRQGSPHYRTIESLRLTAGLETARVQTLDAFRRRRNIAEYERAGMTSTQEAAEMRALAAEVRDVVLAWLRQAHPELL